ncbi:MAG: tRNA uridine-5-carboxymethylaminomethyl(34) synthesis enzyme MnmG [Oscillospiraceae bacterium]|jgi:tRNA uridine 5-carboxymethylaminomethyl modification enzyme|nr:tRNA uridine-5-carboxymethylaminomethyl(34) synthesis enzyme MnmG [Oscillospiraceae bacterium]
MNNSKNSGRAGEYSAGDVDVAVIGAGHAGVEAALASARLGCETIIFSINLDAVGNLPCNPSIGGTAKGHLVREVDALGGEMGRAADACTIQSRMLNKGKGPAVHSLRAQIDRRKYSEHIKSVIENQENLHLKQAEIAAVRRAEESGADCNSRAEWEVVTRFGAVFKAKCVIIATGTYLKGKIFVGQCSYSGGPDGMFAADMLGDSLKELGVPLRRFKTGTPARVHKASIDYSGLEVQEGDEVVVPFSYDTKEPIENKVCCHVSWTGERTREVVMENLHLSPMYSGAIEGVGPRYCPSIEDKIVRFPEKGRHQCFIEPCGLDTQEMYLQGISTSLPEEVQEKLYRTMSGLQNVRIMRTAYAIEYDCTDPSALNPTLEFTDFPSLYGAGQFNGSSGYEEAAAQGLVAGINAARKVRGEEQIVFSRAESYIGTLIDDLVTKGVSDPYRMMTSRSEYRLVLRQDNADRRLTPLGREIGLIGDDRWERYLTKTERIEAELKRVRSVNIPPSEEVNAILTAAGTAPITTGFKLFELIRRPQLSYAALASVDQTRGDVPADVLEQAEIEIKYEGYISRQNSNIAEMKRLERKLLPADIDYGAITGIRLEAAEKLQKIRPLSVGQASRISGVSPADLSVLLIHLSRISREEQKQ